MYNRVEFPKTPRWARHMLRLNKVAKLQISPEIHELARVYSWTPEDLPPTVRFSKPEYDALQYVIDFDGRCVLVDTKTPTFSRVISTLAAQLLGAKSILIAGRNTNDSISWLQSLRQSNPQDAVVTTDGRKNRTTSMGNPEVADRTWIIATQPELVDPTIVTEYKVDFMILDLEEANVHYDAAEVVSGLAIEIPRTLIISRSNDFWSDSKDNKSSLKISSLLAMMQNVLQINTYLNSAISEIGMSQSVTLYFRTRGIKLNAIQMLEAAGVCTDLVADPANPYFRNMQNSSFLSEFGAPSKRRIEIIERHTASESRIEQKHGRSIKELVESAVAGDLHSRGILNELRLHDWSKLKANTFYNLLQSQTSREDKIVIVTDNMHIRKYMTTSVGAIELFGTAQDIAQKQANFCFPNPNHSTFEDLPVRYTPRINNRLIANSITQLDTRVLESADTIIFAEIPYDSAEVADFIELSKLFGFRMIFGTMRGTFEEYLADMVLGQFY